jgi:hypothetical protein
MAPPSELGTGNGMPPMDQVPTARLPSWSQRVLDGSSLPLFWIGVLLALGFLLAFVVLELALGRFAEYSVNTYREDLRVAAVLCLLAAYLPVAWIYSVRSARRTADELMPSLTRGAGTVGLEEAGRFDRAGLRKAGVVGVALLGVALFFAEAGLSSFLALGQMSPEAYFHRLLLVWIGWFGGRFAYAIWVESKRFSQIGRERMEIDLLDLASVEPLVRYGLRQALVTIGAFSVLALMFYDSEAAPNLIWFLLGASLSILLLATVGLLIPVRGVHDAIAREKTQEFARVNDQIRRARAGSGALPNLADWIAYRSLIASVREWPVDAPTLRRFALYLAIPLGSWLGGALVERMLDALLG